MRISDWSSDVCSSDLKAEHILCSPDRQATFKSIYAGERPAVLHKCRAGAEKVARDAETVRKMGVSGTPTLFVDGKLVSGFQQAELEAFIEASNKKPTARSEESRVGKECVRTCRSRGLPYH